MGTDGDLLCQLEHPPADSCYPPPFGSLERRIVLESIQSDYDACKEVESRIAELQNSLKSLKASICRKKDIICPIRCMPPEVLSYIFSFLEPVALPYEVTLLANYMTVCKQWAQVISNTPNLWSHFEIYNQYGDWVASRLTKMLSKFPNHPLRVDAPVRGYVDVLKPHVRRLTHLTLSVDEDEYASWMNILPNALVLEKLHLEVDRGFPNTPALKTG